MGKGGKLCLELDKILGGWDFISSNSRGRSGGLISRWRTRFLKCTRYASVYSRAGVGYEHSECVWALCR
jgi:hypothetical protein